MEWKWCDCFHAMLIIFCTIFIFKQTYANEQFSFDVNWAKQEYTNSSDVGTDVVVYGNYVYSLSLCGPAMCINKYGLDGQRIFNRTYYYTNNTILGSNMIIRNQSIYVLATAGNDTATKIPCNQTIGTLGATDLYLVQYDETTGNFVRGVLFGTPGFDISAEVVWSEIDQTFVVVSSVFGSFNGNPFLGQLDIIVAKFASNLTMLWSKQYGSFVVERGIGVSVDNDALSPYYGYITAVGETYGDVAALNAGNSDILVIQLNSDGTYSDLYQTGTSGLDSPGGVTDDANNIYVLGVLQSTQVSILRLTKELEPNSTFTITSSSQSFSSADITKDLDGGLLVLGYDLGFGCWFVGKAVMEDGELLSMGIECTQLKNCYVSYFTCGGGLAVGNTSNEFFVSGCSSPAAYNGNATNSLDAYTVSFKQVPEKHSHGGGSGISLATTAIILISVFGTIGVAVIAGLAITVYKLKSQQNLGRSNSEAASESSAANSKHVSMTSMSKHSSSETHWAINYNDVHLKKKIGVGGFGEVYRAKWKGSDVAVKLLMSQDNQQTILDFFAEAEVMKKLRPHPNVVQLIGFFENPLGIVTEYVPRGSLESWLRSDKPISDQQKISVLHGTALGMLYLHSEGVLHRDLAARNILLDKTLSPKVCDFGLSRVMIDERTHKSVNAIGPIRWMAPEALTESKYNKKSDVWSFGVVTYEVMTRQEPYHGINLFEVSLKVSTGELSLVSDLAPRAHEFPPVLVSILSICLQVDPAWRPEFTQLAEWLESHTVQSPSISLMYEEDGNNTGATNENPQDKYKASRDSRLVDGSFLPS